MFPTRPTVGRILDYWPCPDDRIKQVDPDSPLAAIVAHVHGPSLVNVTVLDALGQPFPRDHVPFHWNRDGQTLAHSYCCWSARQLELIRLQAYMGEGT